MRSGGGSCSGGSGGQEVPPSPGLAVLSALPYAALFEPGFSRGFRASPCACVILSCLTRGLALRLPPCLRPAVPGAFLRGPGRPAWRQHHASVEPFTLWTSTSISS
ncbi:U6 snRNA-associated Sm-like protein LSm2 isoform X3 [Apodemus sylvaticus]|uniref:U6 snRNA-associated Sm-like protein LSm2 isoform X3 n=1 Tax=Apodemus sylvaticus TaxID=10129 RepID=UPI002242EB96|nr:U6 snRNA-associated Sm-like protein LSm2 isoform X3 [Apodemus sylvaticus]